MLKYIKKFDIVAQNPSKRLHFGKKSDHQTPIGGICSLIGLTIFTALSAYSAYNIAIGNNPLINKLEFTVTDTKEEAFHFDDAYQITFILKDIAQAFEIDKRKLHVYAERIEYTYHVNE